MANSLLESYPVPALSGAGIRTGFEAGRLRAGWMPPKPPTAPPSPPPSTTGPSPGAEGMPNGARMTQVCHGGAFRLPTLAEEVLQGGVGFAQFGHGFGDHFRPVGPEDVDVGFADDVGNEVVEFVGELHTSRGQF
jgi:hypothetical protein